MLMLRSELRRPGSQRSRPPCERPMEPGGRSRLARPGSLRPTPRSEAQWRSSFARLDAACRANDAAAAHRELGAWARRAGRSSIASLCDDEPGLRTEVDALERRLYAPL